MELTPGFLLKDRYLIKEQLGKGGMGAVFLAEDTALDQLVAVKSNAITSEQGRRQFETEARLLAKLRHPNLPLVTDHFILDNVQYLVMDYIPGDDLKNRLLEEGPQSVQDVLKWGEQIADALNYLHSQVPPVIHRDIKPANLKLTPDGKIVLVDFGIAKATEGDTTVGARGYSPGYAPPEQYSSANTGPYSDQYSLAATLYTLLTGGPPPESIDMMLGQETLTSSRLFSREIPIHVDNALQKAMEIEPDNRFSSIMAFMHALKDPAALADATVPYGAEGQTDQPTMRSPKRNRGWLWAVGGIVILGIIGVVGFLALNFLGFIGNPADSQAEASPTTPLVVAVAATDTPIPTNTAIPTPEDTATPTPEPTSTPTPSPEPTQIGSGGKIAFVSQRDDNAYEQIYLMDPDGSNPTQLTFDESHKSWPVWSPDGTKILYVADGGVGPYNNRYNLDIWVMNADGSNQTNLTQYQGVDEDPTWTPDGSQIVWVSRRFGGTRALMLMNTDGSDPVRLSTEFEEYNPTFSPDGETLLFSSTFFFTLNQRTTITDEQTKIDLELWSTPYNFADFYDNRYDESGRIGKGVEPDWAPNGEFIVYVRTTGNNRHIYIVDHNSNGATVADLTTVGLNFDPEWSPDSRWIVFSTTRDGNQEIYIMDFAGRFVTNLTNNEADDKMPSWQPINGGN